MSTATLTTEELVAAILPRLERASGNKNISARCPFPDHEDRNASFSINRLTGLWMCHGSCERKGNAYQLAKELGVLPVRPTRTLDERSSNVDRSTNQRRKQPNRFWRCDGCGKKTQSSSCQRCWRGRVALPGWTQEHYVDGHTYRRLAAALERYGIASDGAVTRFPVRNHDGIAFRTHVRKHEGQPRFYFEPGEYTYHAWVAWDLIREWGKGCGIAYVVEGNRDALTLAAHGWPSIGILGVEHFDKALADIAEPLKSIGIGVLVLTPDNDERGINAVAEWVPKLEAAGLVVGTRRLPEAVNGQTVKDTFDLYHADREHFDDWMHELPVWWRV